MLFNFLYGILTLNFMEKGIINKKKKNKILVIHGPNLNLLSQREPGIYGKFTLSDINEKIFEWGAKEKVDIDIRQSNIEGEIVEIIQKASGNYEAIIINPAAYTHTSIAIRDALLAINIPTIEVHISNIYKREEFRHHSFVADVAVGQISGFGPNSYILGLCAALKLLSN